jgi:fungal STAND N-terminal Goodbye domain
MAVPPMAPTAVAVSGENLDGAWEDACLAFRNVAGIDLKKAVVPSADDIRAKFDGKKAKDADEHRKIDKAKDVFGKTVVCIEKIGNVAAMGASMVGVRRTCNRYTSLMRQLRCLAVPPPLPILR